MLSWSIPSIFCYFWAHTWITQCALTAFVHPNACQLSLSDEPLEALLLLYPPPVTDKSNLLPAPGVHVLYPLLLEDGQTQPHKASAASTPLPKNAPCLKPTSLQAHRRIMSEGNEVNYIKGPRSPVFPPHAALSTPPCSSLTLCHWAHHVTC